MFRKKILIYILITIFVLGNVQTLAVSDLTGGVSLKRKGFIHTFTFDELVRLSENEKLEDSLKNKLSQVLHNPVIDNTIAGDEINLQEDRVIGKFIRVANWNISRGRNFDIMQLILKDPEKFSIKIRASEKNFKKEEMRRIEEQIDILRNTDIFLLNEVDIGMPRTKYRNVAEDFAAMLGYNYAFGVEFVEVDPTHLDLEDHEWSEENILFPNQDYEIDKARYKGFHGNAIISRFPLENVRIIRLPKYYDWFNDEKNKIAHLEVARRKAAEFIFEENVLREIRRGSRIALLADIDVPGMDEPLTVISVHLENRTVPEYRYKQMKYLLERINHIENPVVMGGDFNTTTRDGSPTTIKREIKKKITDFDYIAKQLIYLAIPYSYAVSGINAVTNIFRKHNNPTVVSVPIVSPNEERKLFNILKDTEFKGGEKFDFSGERYQSANRKRGLLANSNQRSLKGFVPTFVFTRDWEIGEFKLDWLFVKPGALVDAHNDLRKLMPFYGRTMLELNYSITPPVSDHTPITVDLPLNPPSEDKAEEIRELLEEIENSDKFKSVPLPG